MSTFHWLSPLIRDRFQFSCVINHIASDFAVAQDIISIYIFSYETGNRNHLFLFMVRSSLFSVSYKITRWVSSKERGNHTYWTAYSFPSYGLNKLGHHLQVNVQVHLPSSTISPNSRLVLYIRFVNLNDDRIQLHVQFFQLCIGWLHYFANVCLKWNK